MFTGSAGDGSFISGLPRSRAEAPGMLGGLLWTHGASDTVLVYFRASEKSYMNSKMSSHKRGQWGEIESLAFKQLKL